jgi:hypothetical protein
MAWSERALKPIVPVALLALLGSGCAHQHLKRGTVKMTGTLTNIYYREVLDNLAMFVENPDAMPYFSVPGTGNSTVNEMGQSTATLTWNPTRIMSEVLGISAQRSTGKTWTFATTTDTARLNAMRCAYQIVVGGGTDEECMHCHRELEAILGKEYCECHIFPGWFHCGGKRDVPRDACYVGHYGRTCVWVTPAQLDGLTKFTMAMIKIATASPLKPKDTAEVTVYYKSDPNREIVVKRTITADSFREAKAKAEQEARAKYDVKPGVPLPNAAKTLMRDRLLDELERAPSAPDEGSLNLFEPNRGLFFVPRP